MSTYCDVEKELVIKAANFAIRRVKEIRRADWKKRLHKAMNRRFFPRKTILSAAKAVKAWNDHPNWLIMGWGIMSHAERLLAASNVCSCDQMKLDSEDAQIVSIWLNGKLR